MSRSPRHRLDDILDTAQNALAVLKDRSAVDIEHDWLLRHGLQSAIVTIAEAAKALPSAMTARHPNIPWSEIIGMGVKIKHHYHRVAPRLLWDTVVGDFPTLLTTVKQMLRELDA